MTECWEKETTTPTRFLRLNSTKTLEPFPELGMALKRTALKNGFIMRIDPSWFALAPALISKESDIEELCDLVEQSLRDALELVKL